MDEIIFVDLEKDALRAIDMMLETRLGHADRLGDIVDGCSTEAIFDHQRCGDTVDFRGTSWHRFWC